MSEDERVMVAEAFAWAPFLAGFASALVVAVFGEHLRRLIVRPRLRIDFDPKDSSYISRTVETTREGSFGNEAYYIRLRVQSAPNWLCIRTSIEACKGYLINIEKLDDNGIFRPTEYCDSIQLGWSVRGAQAFEPIDIPPGVSQFLDVLSTRPTSTAFRLSLFQTPNRYALKILPYAGTYRFTMLIAGDNVAARKFAFTFSWTDTWDGFTANGVPATTGNAHAGRA